MRGDHRGGVQVSVGEDNVGGLAPEFGDDRREVDRSRLQHLTHSGATTGEMDFTDAGMLDQSLPPVGASGYDIDQSRWQAGLDAQFTEAQRRQRCQLGWLEDHRVSRGQCRGHAGSRHNQGSVPGRDDADDTEGFALDEIDIERARDRCARPVRFVGVPGKVTQEPLQEHGVPGH